jgi:ApbE superfamily uncharacterized protein (UPF0280 family)
MKRRYQSRFYRERVKGRDLFIKTITEKETDLQIAVDKELNESFVRERIRLYRSQIEGYINKDKRFLTALKPLEVELGAPLVVRRMAQAAKQAGCGPMAAVAGAIAEFLGRDLLRKGYREVIVENGGDLFLKIQKVRSVGIYTGRQKLWGGLSLKINPKDTPLGICSSSGTVGHSLSFGCADTVLILSKSSCIADAVATAVCNRVKTKQDLQDALSFARKIRQILGVIIIFKNQLISWGNIELA